MITISNISIWCSEEDEEEAEEEEASSLSFSRFLH